MSFHKNNSITSNHKIVFLFSGQGSHYRGMGENLYKTYPVFANSLHKSDALMQQHLGQSLIETLYEKKDKVFDDLLLTHPAIVAVELAMLDLMQDLGITPDYVVGNSLGEFAAGVAGGIWTKEMALETAIEQAKSIVQGDLEGGMLAVINESPSNLKSLLDASELHVASKNFAKHFTISGKKKHLDIFEKKLNQLGISFLRLAVNYPFHSPLIEAGRTGFTYYTYTTPSFNAPSQKFVSGLFCKKLEKDMPNDYFWQVISQASDFSHLVQYMESLGSCLYLDLGPSGTSTTFVKYNLSEHSKSTTHSIMSPYKTEIKQLKSLQNLLQTIT